MNTPPLHHIRQIGEPKMGRTINHQSFFDFGLGVDSIQQRNRGRAIRPADARPMQGAAGQSTLFRLDMIESQRNFEKVLNIASSASLSYGLEALGAGASVDAKFDFAEENTYSEYNLTILARVKVENPTLLLQAPELLDEAKELYAISARDFHERYGDTFISGLHTGGEFFGLIIVETKDKSSKESVHANLTASGAFGAWSGSFGIDVNKKTLETTSTKRTKVMILRSGAGGRVESDINGMMEMARNFPSEVAATAEGKGWPFAVDLTEYKLLDLPPTANAFDLERQRELLTYLGQQRTEALSKLKECQYILANPGEFDTTTESLSQLGTEQQRLAVLLDAIYTQASSCFNNYSKCRFAEDQFVVPVIQLPDRKVQSKGISCILTAGPNSWPRFPIREINKFPDFEATAKLTVHYAEERVPSARYAGIGVCDRNWAAMNAGAEWEGFRTMRGVLVTVARAVGSAGQLIAASGGMVLRPRPPSSPPHDGSSPKPLRTLRKRSTGSVPSSTPPSDVSSYKGLASSAIYTDETVHLKLTKMGNLISTAYSADGAEWIPLQNGYNVGDHLGVDFDVFLFAYSADATPVTAQFHDVEVSPL
ncbi:hypothetical protein ACFWVP_20145 [Streptomyces sp. NPDC058637]|uniref:hypothetical protein n=1 Tax=Streptomyces sp. NPDC058637 TaxID=3346569 RepID=UPI003657042C